MVYAKYLIEYLSIAGWKLHNNSTSLSHSSSSSSSIRENWSRRRGQGGDYRRAGSMYRLPMTSRVLREKSQSVDVGLVTRSQAVARIADCTAKNCRGHVTQATLTFREIYLCACLALPIQSRESNLKSQAQVVSKICSIVCVSVQFQENYLCARQASPIQSCIPNLKSLAQVVFEILRSKRIGVTSLTFQGHVTSSVT